LKHFFAQCSLAEADDNRGRAAKLVFKARPN